jgi:hypothetical protein
VDARLGHRDIVLGLLAQCGMVADHPAGGLITVSTTAEEVQREGR